jgi:dephospho-CoA kinase
MQCAKFVVGLTGGIGSGKTTVAALFAQLGVTIIDTDQLARDLTAPTEPAYVKIIEHFGNHILLPNNQLDRKALRKIIFADSQQRLWLEKLLHPLIREETRRLVKLATSTYCIAVIPLLLEGAPNPLINRILVVDATEDIQIKRTGVRDNHTETEVKNIMQSQITRSKRLAAADDIIINDGKLADLKPQVVRLHNFYLSLCKPSHDSG